MMNNLGLYIHIPFCKKKCAYCDFYSTVSSEEVMKAYASAVKRQIAGLSPEAQGRKVDSVYIGGGTPSILPPELLLEILEAAKKHFDFLENCEISMEANPATVTKDSLCAYRQMGINRLSFGVQSSNDPTLKKIGRLHSYKEALDSIELADSCGFSNLNADLMYGLPGQHLSDLLSAIGDLENAGLSHISLYGLRVEKNTPFGRDRSLVLPSEEFQSEMYLRSVEALEKRGFRQYEISNFSKEGRACRHNLRYWLREEYLVFGPSACSFFGNFRFSIPRALGQYLGTEDFSLSSPLYTEREELTEQDRLEEEIILSLRLKQGCEEEKLIQNSHEQEKTLRYLSFLVSSGYAGREGGRFFLSPAGMLVSNEILSELLLQIL